MQIIDVYTSVWQTSSERRIPVNRWSIGETAGAAMKEETIR